MSLRSFRETYKPQLLIVAGAAFGVAGFILGSSAGWNLDQPLNGRHLKNAPMWVFLLFSFALAASGLFAGTLELLQRRAEKQRAANVAEFQSILRSSWKREEPEEDQQGDDR